MKRTLLFISIALLLAFSTAPFTYCRQSPKGLNAKDSDTLFWSKDRKLAVSDYKTVNTDTGQEASSQFQLNIDVAKKENNYYIVVKSFFVKSASWMRKNIGPQTLQHEQGHFDIFEINARLLRKELAELKYNVFKDTYNDEDNNKVQTVYNKYYVLMGKMHNAYDADVKGGTDKIDKAKQDAWTAKLAAQLKDLDAFSDPDDK